MKKKNGDKGFSILAALMAFLIVGTALVALLELFVASTFLGKKTEYFTRAVYLANSRLEEFRVLPYEELVDSIEKYHGLYLAIDTVEKFSRETKVQWSGLEHGALEIRVSVKYPVGAGKFETYSAFTLKTNHK